MLSIHCATTSYSVKHTWANAYRANKEKDKTETEFQQQKNKSGTTL